MIKQLLIVTCICVLLILTGCKDQAELIERAFIMGIAIDKADNGRVKVTVQILKPTQGIGMAGQAQEKTFINITTKNDTVARAVRDIPLKLGRKAQFSHTRLIIISEQLAREKNISDLLEFFYRDHEPRLTISVMIAKGLASPFLSIDPHVENTTSQQLFQSLQSSANFNEKTLDINLLKLGIQIKSQVGNTLIPYLYSSKKPTKNTVVAGAALLKKGLLVGIMKPSRVESLHMLTNEYQNGMIDVPCHNQPNNDQMMEAVEIVAFKSKLKPTIITEQSLKVHVKISTDLSIVELRCSKIETIEDEEKFVKAIEKTLKKQIIETTKWLKEIKFDAVGLGNLVYQKNPSLWKKWKPNWDDRFAESNFEIEVEAHIINSGTIISVPFNAN